MGTLIITFKNGERDSKKVHGDRKRVEKEIVLQIVEKLKGKYTITAILNSLEVPRANYYRWCHEGILKPLTAVEEALLELCKRTRYQYSHRKIKALLKEEYEIQLNRNTVQNLMQKLNLQCRIKSKRK